MRPEISFEPEIKQDSDGRWYIWCANYGYLHRDGKWEEYGKIDFHTLYHESHEEAEQFLKEVNMEPVVKQYGSRGWYIVQRYDGGRRCRYLLKSGKWNEKCDGGWYTSKEEAEEFLKETQELQIGDLVEIVFDGFEKGQRGNFIGLDEDSLYIIEIEGKQGKWGCRNSFKKVTGEVAKAEQMFCNHYFCDDCELDWESEWDCECDDKCASCNTAYTPYYSENITGQI